MSGNAVSFGVTQVDTITPTTHPTLVSSSLLQAVLALQNELHQEQRRRAEADKTLRNELHREQSRRAEADDKIFAQLRILVQTTQGLSPSRFDNKQSVQRQELREDQQGEHNDLQSTESTDSPHNLDPLGSITRSIHQHDSKTTSPSPRASRRLSLSPMLLSDRIPTGSLQRSLRYSSDQPSEAMSESGSASEPDSDGNNRPEIVQTRSTSRRILKPKPKSPQDNGFYSKGRRSKGIE